MGKKATHDSQIRAGLDDPGLLRVADLIWEGISRSSFQVNESLDALGSEPESRSCKGPTVPCSDLDQLDKLLLETLEDWERCSPQSIRECRAVANRPSNGD